jgi:hypothetical protein
MFQPGHTRQGIATPKRASALASAVVAACVLCTAPVASAQPADPAALGAPWRYSMSIYGYLPAITGAMTFAADNSGNGLTMTPEMILNKLKFTFMGAIDMNNGRWGVFSDLLYVNLGEAATVERDLTIGGRPLPVGATAKLDLGVEGSVWTLAGEYRLVSDAALTMDVLAGVRRFDMSQTLAWDITGNVGDIAAPLRKGQSEIGVLVWDAIVGVKGRLHPAANAQWTLPYYFDVGAGGSRSTWQVAAGVGYRFGWGEASAMWRYLKYRFEDESPIKSMDFNGPLVGATFRW